MDRRNIQSQLPTGVKIYLPDEAARLRGLQERLIAVFRLWGYREVMTPTFEFFDVLALGTDETLQEGMFKFVDPDTGRWYVTSCGWPGAPFGTVIPGSVAIRELDWVE